MKQLLTILVLTIAVSLAALIMSTADSAEDRAFWLGIAASHLVYAHIALAVTAFDGYRALCLDLSWSRDEARAIVLACIAIMEAVLASIAGWQCNHTHSAADIEALVFAHLNQVGMVLLVIAGIGATIAWGRATLAPRREE